MQLAQCIATVLADRPHEHAIEYGGQWRSRAEVHVIARHLDALLSEQGLGASQRIGLVARNRPGHIAAFAGLLATRRCAVMIYSAQSPEAIAADIRKLNLCAVVADREDWSDSVVAAARETGAFALQLDHSMGGALSPVRGLERPSERERQRGEASVAMELLSSGTTGKPKRVPLSWQAFEAAARDAAATYASGAAGEETGPSIVFHPLGNIAGVTFIIPFLIGGRPMVLFERFVLQSWLAAVRQYRPARASLPPPVLRMLLDENVSKEDLASFASIGVGAAALDPELQQQFENRYGIPLLAGYGATEFCGVIANWTLPMYREFGAAKRGSVGRPRPGVTLRVVDAHSGNELPAGSVGVLEAKVLRVGDEWIETTDLASIDADGFLYLHGRADGAINRGGFKVLPDEVARVLRQHPAVGDAAVIGIEDARLGQVPVAAVEPRAGGPLPTVADIEAFAQERLVAYHRPVQVLVLPGLPRNPSMKVDLPALKRLFERDQQGHR